MSPHSGGGGAGTTVIEGCAIATVDAAGTEYSAGHIVIDGNRITAVGSGPAPPQVGGNPVLVDGTGLLATPGLVNTHHHLCQWLTRGYAQQSTLFEWLVDLYPIWAGMEEELVHAAAQAGIAALVRSGCSTSTDHHYLHPRDGGDLLGAEIKAAQSVGIRFHPTRGSMDLGASSGGLPPDNVVEATDAILAATQAAIDKYHDPAFDSMLRIAVAPCAPFTVTERLMRESAELARTRGVRMHTHLAETVEEDAFCAERYGMRPVEYLDQLGWLGPDVWLAHCVHLDARDIARFGATGTGVAHCPTSNGRLGAGIAPVAALHDAKVAVGLAVDGAASNEAGELLAEVHESILLARLRGGPRAMTARTALELGTMGGAKCLGREAEIGSLEPGKLADVALWRMDDLAHAGIDDPVAALVLGPVRPVNTLIIQGRVVVADERLMTVDEAAVATALTRACAQLRDRARVTA